MSIPVSYPYNASSANTSSSKLALPERSPRPLTQVWGTATPASTAARLFATARRKSVWPGNESSVGFRRRFSCPKNQAIPGGVITPTVSQTTARWAPAAVQASYSSTTKSRSARNVSSVTNDTSTPWATAYSVSRTAASFTWSRVIASLCLMCKSDPAVNNAISSTSQAMHASTSFRTVRAAAMIVASSPAFAIMRTPRASSLETTGMPTSIIGTWTSSRRCAIRTFSSGVYATPGVCSPSRKVSSQIRIPFARDPKKGWSYDPKDAASYVDIYGLDPRDSYSQVRAGEWAEGRVICFGFLKRVRARRISTVGPILESGSRLVGAVRVNSKVEIDFGLFQSELAFESDDERRKILKEAGVKAGSFVATDVGVDIELKPWGSKETVLRHG